MKKCVIFFHRTNVINTKLQFGVSESSSETKNHFLVSLQFVFNELKKNLSEKFYQTERIPHFTKLLKYFGTIKNVYKFMQYFILLKLWFHTEKRWCFFSCWMVFNQTFINMKYCRATSLWCAIFLMIPTFGATTRASLMPSEAYKSLPLSFISLYPIRLYRFAFWHCDENILFNSVSIYIINIAIHLHIKKFIKFTIVMLVYYCSSSTC